MKNFDTTDKFFSFISDNISADLTRLRLSYSDRNPGIPLDLALTQIEARRKTSRKLSFFINNPKFLFPSVLAAEQSSHQAVADYHAKLIGSGQSVVDLTAGLGIDAMSIAKNGNHVLAMELDNDRANILKYNVHLLGLDNPVSKSYCRVERQDSIKWLAEQDISGARFDWLFVDPARRNSDNARTYFLKDCVPDIITNFELLQRYAERIMIKASPILDITSVVREVPDVYEIHLVCVKGECKEVLIIAKGFPKDSPAKVEEHNAVPKIQVVDIKDTETYEPLCCFELGMDRFDSYAPIAQQSDFCNDSYLYDPNAGIHKLNVAGELCNRFPGMKRIASNTDLYVSASLHQDFPGRIFRIHKIASKADLKTLKGERCEIISRNYPLTADQIRNKHKMRSGENCYLVACRITKADIPKIFLCNRV